MKGYWFFIDSYVYVNVIGIRALLYNTLDGNIIKVENAEVANLLLNLLSEDNCGVCFLEENDYLKEDMNCFINELRDKYMGDVIDVSLSKGKPIQILPYVNFPSKIDMKYNYTKVENLLNLLLEIKINIGINTDVEKIISYLDVLDLNIKYTVFGNLNSNCNSSNLIRKLEKISKNIDVILTCDQIQNIENKFEDNVSYKVVFELPIELEKILMIVSLLEEKKLQVKYVFNLKSIDEYKCAEKLVEKINIEKCEFNPVCTGENVDFFMEYVYLDEEDIESVRMSMKDFFIKRFINTNDFGKITIDADGTIYANINQPALGTIYTCSMFEIIQKELKTGKSWLRTRVQEPCNNCLYRLLCPSPSDYDLSLGKMNLCHVK